MSFFFLDTRKRRCASIFVAICAALVAACSGPSSPLGPSFHSDSDQTSTSDQSVIPAAKPSPTPYDFSFTTVDDPGSNNFNEATSINQLGDLAGNYGSGSRSQPSHGWITEPPYAKFRQVDYPGAVNTDLMSMTTDHLRAGYFVDNTKEHNTWGFVQNHGIFTLYKDFKTPKEPGFVDELLCINGSDIAVGFYEDTSGNDHPFELIVDANKYTPLRPPGAQSAQATVVNLRGDIAGSETTTSGKVESWLLRGGVYTTLAYPGATSTQAFGLDFEEQIVGAYTDSRNVTHGFILSNPTGAKYWQSVDDPGAAGTTVITSINAPHSIAGWYVDSRGNRHGFTAIVNGSKR